MPPAEAGAKILCPTPHALQIELDALATVLEPDEREDTWEKFERALIRFAAITRGGGYKHLELYVRGVGNKGVGLRIVDCMLSDRGRLSGVSTDLLQTFAPRLAAQFHSLIHLYLPPLVRLLARPNKVYLKRAEKCLQTIITHCHLPSILIYLRNGLDDKSDACKRASAVGVERAVLEWDRDIWNEKGLDVLELCIRKMATDRDADVRKTGKRVWALFMDIWPERIDDFSNPLTPTIRRYLDIPAADGVPSKPKTRSTTRPLQAALRAAASAHDPPAASSTSHLGRGEAAHAGPSRRTRLARVASNTTDEDEHHAPPPRAPLSSLGRATRTVSASQTLQKQTSASSLNDKQESARHTLLSKPSRTLPPSSFNDGARRQPLHRTQSQELRRPHSAEPDQTPRHRDDALSSSSRSSSTRRQQPSSPRRLGRSATSAHDSSENLPTLASSFAPPAPIPPPVGRVKARVSDFERMVGESTPPARVAARAEVKAVAAIPLPPSPTVRPITVKDSPPSPRVQQRFAPPKNHNQLTESPSLSSLLRKTDAAEPDMSLLDLSVANVSVAQSPAPRRPASTSSLKASSTPKPGVTDLIQKFSPQQMHTPLRRSSMDNPGSATPTQKAMRRISPLPRRSLLSTPVDDSSPPRLGMKRKGSDPEIAFPEEVRPVEREPPKGPRFSQPLIAFGDSPARDTSFVFGGLASASSYSKMGMRRESTLHDLMSLANPSAFEVLATPAKAHAALQPEALVEEDEGESHDADVTLGLVGGANAAAPLAWSTSSGPVEDLLDMDETAILTAAPVDLVPDHLSPVLSREPDPITTTSVDSNDDNASEGDTIREPGPPKDAELEEPQSAVSENSEPVKETQFDEPVAGPERAEPESDRAEPEPEHTEPERAEPEHAEPERAEPEHVEPEREEPKQVTEQADEIAPVEESSEPPVQPPTAEPTVQPAMSASPIARPPAVISVSVAPPTPRCVSAPVPSFMQLATDSATTSLEVISEAASSAAEEPAAEAAAGSAEFKAGAKPNPLQTSQRSALGPRRPANAPIRPGTRTVSHPIEKKSFRPVSKLLGDKGAPAPAKLATKSTTKEQEKLSTSQKRSASAMTKSAASTISKGTATAASTMGKAAGLNSSTNGSESAPPTRRVASHTRNTASSLFKPTAATAARAAATATTKPEPPATKPPSRPGTVMGNSSSNSSNSAPKPVRPAAAPAAARTRSGATSGLFASTAASRARNAEAALPPSKRQRVKLKAPMESFRPGRSANKSKASVLGTSSAAGAGRRPLRAVARRDAQAETFPLPGPGLSMSTNALPVEAPEKASERSVRSSPPDVDATKPSPAHSPMSKTSTPAAASASPVSIKSSSLAIPTPSTSTDDYIARTPTSTSPIAMAERLSPNSTRTSRSRDSGSSPGSKIASTLPKALDPVLTAVHGADVLHRTPSKRGSESPAVLHSRRISGIPPSLKKMLDAQKAERDGTPVPEENDDDENVVVIRSDVSTPTGKSSAILARFSDRGVLQDAN
ncbi:hypothetical protein A1Q2_03481 [Trichosporon asahii var. asahii CBS 8904]|uniref:CLASP N-terminal domain-containing protein n=1 Tax=Trichosporon asahii var. asahii (strain CBS 8904) TaxID=1220162 RepID=K1WLR5_TRIAC|nr:hypothetical protein A1Q2_03481 [Trichosporon asahii var. asahii CBS 8904]